MIIWNDKTTSTGGVFQIENNFAVLRIDSGAKIAQNDQSLNVGFETISFVGLLVAINND